MRVSELQLALAVKANDLMCDIRQEVKEIKQQHKETIDRLKCIEGRASFTSGEVHQQLCEALVNALDRGNAVEVVTIQRVLAFLGDTPSNIGPAEVQRMLVDLQGQIGEAQEDKCQAEAELLRQFAEYLDAQGRSNGQGSGAGTSAGAETSTGAGHYYELHLTCSICEGIYRDPVRYTPIAPCAHTRTHARMHVQAHCCTCACVYLRVEC